MISIKRNRSTRYLLLTLAGSIFVSETAIMLFIDLLPVHSKWLDALLDATLLLIVSFPAIFLLAFRPLNIQLIKREEAENELSTINRKLQKNEKELRVKNNELQRANILVMESERRYANLFEFAPVGYLILTSNGLITKANNTSAELLGVDKNKLLKRNIDSFLTPEERDYWHLQIQRILDHKDKQNCKLVIQRDDGTVFYALMDCQREDTLTSPNIRVSFTDITKQNFHRRLDDRSKQNS